PNVNPEEMKSALRWKVKDLIDFHIDDATIDVFPMPASARSGSAPMINAVVARTSLIQQRVDLLHSLDIEPEAIDITELALHNITRTTLEQDSVPIAAMYLLPDNVYIEVSDPGALYLSRNIAASLDQLSEMPVADDNGWQTTDYDSTSNAEMLSLEMQRSMDYFESHYGKGPANDMRMFQSIGEDNQFIDALGRDLPFRVRKESLSEAIPGVGNINTADLTHYLPAIGAALRAA
ncbi:MAG: hypothetical protein AAF420_06865, partial [Pseudomonadota bacterium]